MQKLKNLLPEDFDKAVAQPYHALDCLIAQAMKRQGIPIVSGMSPVDFALEAGARFDHARHLFDINFYNPGDETKPELQALRASLPIS